MGDSGAVPSRVLLRSLLLAATVALLAPSAASAQTSRPGPVGQDPFVPFHRYRGDFPDPSVLRVGQRFFAYATTTAGLDLPVMVSRNAKRWTATGPGHQLATGGGADALTLPTWAWRRKDQPDRGMTWAPSVAHWNGRYVAAYTVRISGHHTMCISTAVSASPRGPFVDRTTAPLVCPRRRGAIDPMLYREHKRNYLLYKTEDLRIGRPTRIWIQRLTRSGRTLADRPPVRLLAASRPWERDTVEGPAMIRFHGHHYLFYSAGGWANPHYAIGYATCDSVTGPCRRMQVPAERPTNPPKEPPFLSSGDGLVAPGGPSPFVDLLGRLRLAYHAWDQGAAHYPKSIRCRTSVNGCGQRRLHVARLGVHKDGSLVVRALG